MNFKDKCTTKDCLRFRLPHDKLCWWCKTSTSDGSTGAMGKLDRKVKPTTSKRRQSDLKGTENG